MNEHPAAEGAARDLEGKVAVVTGGSRGIGFACAEALAARGAKLLLASSNAERLAQAAARIGTRHAEPAVCAGDLRTLAACEALAAALDATYGRCDILVHSAGATKGGRFTEQADEEWLDGFALKFHAAVRVARALWPRLVASHGTVVNIVGGFARTPAADFMVGGAVNAALANFSKALAAQGLRDDVNVNWIHPGLTVTERLEEIFERRAAQQGSSAQAILDATVREEGLRRLGQPGDVAELVAFLCSPAARHVHGTAICVDGGGSKGVY